MTAPRHILSVGLVLIVLAISCGEDIPIAVTPEIIYKLDRTFTSQKTNKIILDGIDGSTASLGGDGLRFSGDSGNVSLPAEVEFSYKDFGKYTVLVELTEADGSVYVSDTLDFEYFSTSVDDPIVSFEERATNDDRVVLQISDARRSVVTEIMVTGDVAENNGEWQEIPRTSKIVLKLTPEDGTKKFTVATRNIYGNVSKNIELTLEKKSKPLRNCAIEILDQITSNGIIEVYVTAEDSFTSSKDLPFFARGFGKDLLSPMKFVEFKKETIFSIPLTKTEGSKAVEIQFSDIADNFCPRKKFDVIVDPKYVQKPISIKEGLFWVDGPFITLRLDPKRFDSRPLDMYVRGTFKATSDTDSWVPFKEEIALELNPVRGPRSFSIQFRHKNPKYAINPDTNKPIEGEPEFIFTDIFTHNIYLRPFVGVGGSASPYTISVPSINGLSKLTIKGCNESYNNIDVTSKITCSTSNTSIEAILIFEDGTSISRNLPL